MAMIEVNHRTLRLIAADIDRYCDAQDAQMNNANQAVNSMLMKHWQGQDAFEFGRSWAGVNASGSVSITLRDSFRNYALGLVACAEDYERTQADVFTAASRLMNFVGGR